RLTTPATILWQTCDAISPDAWSDRLDDFFTDYTLEKLPGIGHFTPLEATEKFAGAIGGPDLNGDRQRDAVQDVVFADRQFAAAAPAARLAGQSPDDDRAAADHVGTALVHRPQRGALGSGHADQPLADRQQIVTGDPRKMNGR